MRYLNGGDTLVMARPRILIIGQSNASGHDSATNLAAGNASYKTSYSTVPIIRQMSRQADPLPWSYYNGSTYTSTTPPSSYGDVAPYFYTGVFTDIVGPELSLARQLGSPWEIVKFTIDASQISIWLSGSGFPTTPGGTPEVWSQLKTFAASAGSIKAIYWMQGEQDATASGTANVYQQNLTTHLAALRSAFGNVPIIVGQLSASTSLTTCPALATVRAAQAAVVNQTAWCTLLNNDDLALIADNVHYTADSQITIGQRVASAYSAAVNATTLSATFTDSTGGSIAAGLNAYAYTLTITNTGAVSASNIAAVITLPAGVGYVSATGTGWTISQASGVVTATRASGATGALPAITINCQTPGSGTGTLTCTGTIVSSNVKTTTNVSDSYTLTAARFKIDNTSHVPLPQTSSEWSNFISDKGLTGWSAPNLLYTLQDSASPAVPAIGTAQLAATGTVSFQQAITGFATKGITFAQTATNYTSSTDASLPDLSATSVLMLGLFDLQNATPGVGQFPLLMGMASSTGFAAEMFQNSNEWYVRNNSNIAQATNVTTGRGVVPIVIGHNVTALSSAGYSDKEKLLPTYAAIAATKLLYLGNDSAYTITGGFGSVYLAIWTGAAAERTAADVKALLQAFTYAPPWT